MKTTFDLPVALVQEVKKLARARETTARDVVQQALTRAIADQKSSGQFELRDASSTGWGTMLPEFHGLPLHDLIVGSNRDQS